MHYADSVLVLGSLTNKFSGVNFNMQSLQMFHSYTTITCLIKSKGSKRIQTPQCPIVGPSSVKFNPLTTSDAIWCHLILAACSVGAVCLVDMFYASKLCSIGDGICQCRGITLIFSLR